MNIDRPDTEDLHAYADGRLPADRAAEIERHLAGHPEDAAFVHSIRQQNELLRRALDPVAAAPLPQSLVAAAAGSRTWSFRTLARTAAVLLVGAFLGFSAAGLLPQERPEDLLADKAAMAYKVFALDPERPVELGADRQAQLVGWLSDRMGMEVELPPFEAIGFRLVGGRLMMGSAEPAALFIYKDNNGRHLAFYIRNDMSGKGDQRRVAFDQRDDIRLASWQNRKAGFALSGPLAETEMETASQLARNIYDRKRSL